MLVAMNEDTGEKFVKNGSKIYTEMDAGKYKSIESSTTSTQVKNIELNTTTGAWTLTSTTLALVNGTYDNMTVGTAKNFEISPITTGDEFIIRETGGTDEIVGDNKDTFKYFAQTTIYNQEYFYPTSDTTVNGITVSSVSATDAGFRINYKNYTRYKLRISGTATNTAYIELSDRTNDMTFMKNHIYALYDMPVGAGIDTHIEAGLSALVVLNKRFDIIKWNHDDEIKSGFICSTITNGTEINDEYYPAVFDLTVILGKEVADYLYNVEASNSGSGINKLHNLRFRKHFYYPSVNTDYGQDLPTLCDEFFAQNSCDYYSISNDYMINIHSYNENSLIGVYSNRFSEDLSVSGVFVKPGKEIVFKSFINEINKITIYFYTIYGESIKTEEYYNDVKITIPENCYFIKCKTNGGSFTQLNYSIPLDMFYLIPYEYINYSLDQLKNIFPKNSDSSDVASNKYIRNHWNCFNTYVGPANGWLKIVNNEIVPFGDYAEL